MQNYTACEEELTEKNWKKIYNWKSSVYPIMCISHRSKGAKPQGFTKYQTGFIVCTFCKSSNKIQCTTNAKHFKHIFFFLFKMPARPRIHFCTWVCRFSSAQLYKDAKDPYHITIDIKHLRIIMYFFVEKCQWDGSFEHPKHAKKYG